MGVNPDLVLGQRGEEAAVESHWLTCRDEIIAGIWGRISLAGARVMRRRTGADAADAAAPDVNLW